MCTKTIEDNQIERNKIRIFPKKINNVGDFSGKDEKRKERFLECDGNSKGHI